MGLPKDTHFFLEVGVGLMVDAPTTPIQFVCEVSVNLVYLPALVAARESCLSGSDNLPGPPLSRKRRTF